MGTNYYIADRKDMSVEIEHIGKFSGGWTFGFQGSKQKSIQEWKDRLAKLASNEVIRDEYHVTYTPEEFWEGTVEESKRQKWITAASYTDRGFSGRGWIENGFRFSPYEFI